jgi:hypothetical protein
MVNDTSTLKCLAGYFKKVFIYLKAEKERHTILYKKSKTVREKKFINGHSSLMRLLFVRLFQNHFPRLSEMNFD